MRTYRVSLLMAGCLLFAQVLLADDPNMAPGSSTQPADCQKQLEHILRDFREPLKMYGYLEPVGQTWIEADGQIHGAKPDERGPIGGGAGYTRIVEKGDYTIENIDERLRVMKNHLRSKSSGVLYTVSALDELLEALKQAKAGQTIFINGDAEIDCSSLVHIDQLTLEIPEGVTLASNRGRNGSRGAIICSDVLKTRPLIKVLGPNVRITGLRIYGPDRKNRLYHYKRAYSEGRGQGYYYQFPISSGIVTAFPNLEVDNCELAGWSVEAIGLGKGTGHHVHHNYIHHNQYNGLGYGICLGTAEALVDYNLFDANRHSIAGSGTSPSGYEACHNVELGEAAGHCFDMHGGSDRKDGTDTAGSWVKIHHNTFRVKNEPWRSAIAYATPIIIRGTPEKDCLIEYNWFCNHKRSGGLDKVAVRCGGNTVIRNNKYKEE